MSVKKVKDGYATILEQKLKRIIRKKFYKFFDWLWDCSEKVSEWAFHLAMKYKP